MLSILDETIDALDGELGGAEEEPWSWTTRIRSPRSASTPAAVEGRSTTLRLKPVAA